MKTDRVRYIEGLLERMVGMHYQWNKETNEDRRVELATIIEDLKKEIIGTINKYKTYD